MQDREIPRTDHPAEAVDIPLPGVATSRDIETAREQFEDADADLESNELHASGRVCARCGRVIGPDDDVRRTASGAFQHETCELP